MCGILVTVFGIGVEGPRGVNDAEEVEERGERGDAGDGIPSCSHLEPDDEDASGVLEYGGYLGMLGRRGPDGVGAARVEVARGGKGTKVYYSSPGDSSLANWLSVPPRDGPEVTLVGSLLQMRGSAPSAQPLVAADGSVLLFNGEIFGGSLAVDEGANDGAVLLAALVDDGNADVPTTMSRIRGPWAFAFWQPEAQRLWYGRDVMGRRSLLWRGGKHRSDPFVLASSLPDSADLPTGWAEVPPGIFSHRVASGPVAQCERHAWTEDALKRIMTPPPRPVGGMSRESAASGLLRVLDEAVRRRAPTPGHLGVLFSGGLDSTVLAALADRHVPADRPIELLNVCFDGGRSPDRATARQSVEELSRLCPGRVWRLVEVDGDFAKDMVATEPYIRQLLCPSCTIMDQSIGVALWLAAGGHGRATDLRGERKEEVGGGYRASSRALLCGMGADEQLAGYARHRTVFEHGGPAALDAELRMDFLRLHARNLGRDDRLIADRGREARFPYLDEDVIDFHWSIPLGILCDLSTPRGDGDKRVLRDCARLLGLAGCAAFPKRAIQFGTRIARQSNVHTFGSNSRANKLNAGSRHVVSDDLPPT